MDPRTVAALIDGGVPILLGVYSTLLGYRVLGRRAGESPAYDRWHERFGSKLQVLGPLIAAFGCVRIVGAFVMS